MSDAARLAFPLHPSSFILRMIWLILGSTIPSIAVCFAAAFAMRRWGPRFGLVDRPGHRKIHAAPMPTAGGLAIWLGIVLPLAVGQIALWGLAEGASSLPAPLSLLCPPLPSP